MLRILTTCICFRTYLDRDVSRERLPTLLLIAILIAITASAFYANTFRGSQSNGQQSSRFNDSIQAVINGSAVILKVRTDGAVFEQRADIKIEIALINNSTKTVTLPTPPEAFTLRIVNSTGANKLVHAAFIGRIPVPANIAPRSELVVERYIWNQTELVLTGGGAVHQRVPPGQYFIQVSIIGSPSTSLPLIGNLTTVIMIR